MSNVIEELTNLEIRNLLLEVLSYEGDDIDTEGKTFKMYGYQGSQADLFRLLNGLIIKRNLKPTKVPMKGEAWGCHGNTLYEYQTINLSRSEILKLFQEFHNLLNQGIISPGAYGSYSTELPYFHVTPLGMECIVRQDFLPYDQDGYLSKLKTVTDLHTWILFYMTEALKCFNANCVNSSMINIGLAGEVVIEELVEHLGTFLRNKDQALHSSFMAEISRDWKISHKYTKYLEYRDKYIANSRDTVLKTYTSTMDKASSTIYATFTRLTRNSLTHPNDLIMDRIQVLMFFMSFVNYCELQYKYINYYKSNS
ncbi:hypothetical protein [Paenibacillus harenae]|uniref:hypothetical protein n=1 Tax=Paenibacillus harenae TaxID=306543 RepID=UPI00279084B7|nr:hypothetical protein [Paenibacillus harenae]MDQ0059470.1 hypothetical protein [Paenibacillus harenae]